MPSIERRNGRWRARWRAPDGSGRSMTFDRKADAERHLAAMAHTRSIGAYVDPSAGRVTFETFADEWAAAQDWKGTTRDSWPPVRARLVRELGSMPLASIDLLALQRAQAKLRKRYARSTATVTMSYAGSIMRAAYANGRIGRDPTNGLRAPKARSGEPDGKVGPEDVPTRAEALAILESAPSKFRAAISLGIAGMRVGEVLGLTVDRIDLEHRSVLIDRQMQLMQGEQVLTTPKAEKVRTIIVPAVVAIELRRHLRDHQSDGLLFRGQRTGGMLRRDRFYSGCWIPTLKQAGLEGQFTFHSLRHFCASTLLAEGAPLAAVAGHLGDTVETVSRTYVHWLRDDREVPAAVLERVLAPAPADLACPTRVPTQLTIPVGGL